MDESGQDKFGAAWSQRKLDMPRRRRELEAYIDRWLPELRTMEPGLVLDIGCGPCDLLEMCREMGHEVVGVDAANGAGGMGDAYLSLCCAECESKNISVYRDGWRAFWNLVSSDYTGKVAVINFRGSIEQCYSEYLVGPDHSLHHNCRELDWDTSRAILVTEVLSVAATWLRDSGILMVHANGTKSTDTWYDETMRRVAHHGFGLQLVDSEGLLAHKWRKP